MKKLRRILAPTDFSSSSQAGVRYAIELAQSEGVEVIVYHVIGREEASPYDDTCDELELCSRDYRRVKNLRAERRARLEEFVEENFGDLLSDVRVRLEVDVGVPYELIIRKAMEEEVGMIVMCTHGKTGLPHIGVGSVAQRVVRHARCPVLSIRSTNLDKQRAAAVG